MKPKTTFAPLLAISLLVLSTGCRESSHPHTHHGNSHGHVHTAPHGGIVAVLGQEEFHLELVPDTTDGTLTVYFLDAHMENFVRVSMESFAGKAVMSGKELALQFAAMGSSATGEKPGNTSMFAAAADWLGTAPPWSLILDHVNVRGRLYTNIVFSVPPGSQTPPQH
jgi:hypothetical protein